MFTLHAPQQHNSPLCTPPPPQSKNTSPHYPIDPLILKPPKKLPLHNSRATKIKATTRVTDAFQPLSNN